MHVLCWHLLGPHLCISQCPKHSRQQGTSMSATGRAHGIGKSGHDVEGCGDLGARGWREGVEQDKTITSTHTYIHTYTHTG